MKQKYLNILFKIGKILIFVPLLVCLFLLKIFICKVYWFFLKSLYVFQESSDRNFTFCWKGSESRTSVYSLHACAYEFNFRLKGTLF